MNLKESAQKRHSVRSYLNKKIEDNKIQKIQNIINECNKKNDFNIQFFTNEPNAFNCFMAHYGKFENVSNYILLIGKKGENTEEKLGYYGAKIALEAQCMGLNTCFVAVTYSKKKSPCKLKNNEKIYCAISIGYGKTEGIKHKSKSYDEVTEIKTEEKNWFKEGVNTALLAPTAMNQQKFKIILNEDNSVSFKRGKGILTKMDIGIVKYHFEIGSGK